MCTSPKPYSFALASAYAASRYVPWYSSGGRLRSYGHISRTGWCAWAPETCWAMAFRVEDGMSVRGSACSCAYRVAAAHARTEAVASRRMERFFTTNARVEYRCILADESPYRSGGRPAD